jgi:hypothetical protein
MSCRVMPAYFYVTKYFISVTGLRDRRLDDGRITRFGGAHQSSFVGQTCMQDLNTINNLQEAADGSVELHHVLAARPPGDEA